jgi:hypothetical protein
VRRLLSVALLLTVVASATVEEVVAVVGRTPILASDLALARMVALVVPGAGEPDASYASRLLEARIRLELQYRHLEETGILYRLSFDPGVAADHLARGLGPEPDARLAESGLGRDDLHELAVRLAATTAYVEQRLRARVHVSASEVEVEYARLLDGTGSREAPPPLFEITDRVQQLLTERKLNTEIERWLEQARERVEVTRFAH